MFYANGEKMSDMEVAQGYWEHAKERMAWCRHEAEEYVKNHGRRKFYKIYYNVGDGEVYSAIDDKLVAALKEDIKELMDFINEEYDSNPSEKVIADELREYFSECGVDWSPYIPEKDQHFVDEPAYPINIDFDDVLYFTRFDIKHTSYYDSDKERLTDKSLNLELNNEEFVNLVAAKLFDKNLTFYDLRVLYKDLYERIEAQCYDVHEHHMIFMGEIDEVAKAIIDSKTEDELPKDIDLDGPFSGLILRPFYKNPDQFDDPALLNALKLAAACPNFFDRY